MSKTVTTSPQERLSKMLETYLEQNVGGQSSEGTDNLELEVRFNRRSKMTRLKYDNVISRLLANGFKTGPIEHFLRINSEYLHELSGEKRISNIRTEIQGVENISAYCKTNSIHDGKRLLKGVKFIRKTPYFEDSKGKPKRLDPVDFNDFGFRVAFQLEKNINPKQKIITSTIEDWSSTKKTFRYITRHRLVHSTIPFDVDVSIVRSSKEAKNEAGYMQYVPEVTLQDSGVLDNEENYEVEVEVNNVLVGKGTDYGDVSSLEKALRQMIKLVLSGIQETNYPISYQEMTQVAASYLELIQSKPVDKNFNLRDLYTRHFAGPSAITLQSKNVAPVNPNITVPNIRERYTVTEKADGIRKLLYIPKSGHIYLIDMNMNIQFTGAVTKDNTMQESLIDGEHILHDKEGKFINLFAAFDIYYLHGENIRNLPLLDDSPEAKKKDSRLTLMTSVLNKMNVQSIVNGQLPPIIIEPKKFYATTVGESIFNGCKHILEKEKQGLFNYNTDGLMFTPMDLAVGASHVGERAVDPGRQGWDYLMKWKPSKWNTIDFFVKIQKDSVGKDNIGVVYQSGIDTSASNQLLQYKTLVLRVGLDPKNMRFEDPCQAILNGNLSNYDKRRRGNYVPVPFIPTSPEDPQASLCNVPLVQSINGDKFMFTEEKEVIEDNMIIEFRYDMDKSGLWRWIPVRIRYDKTADLRKNGRNFGNAYHVADANWHSIHYPITEAMLTTGENISSSLTDDDVYYNPNNSLNSTQAMRDFHNKYVKYALIHAAAHVPNSTLIDLAVGKGGDLPKWISANLDFVFGIDFSSDNIHNKSNGACARYLDYYTDIKMEKMPRALFVVGNSMQNIRNGEGITTEKGRRITNVVFGQGEASGLGPVVESHRAIGESGFNICSVQFAIHYMFSSVEGLHNFLRNVAETTKVNGYFIGTCYDGNTMFNKLRKVKTGGSLSISDANNNKIWEVTKQYNASGFNADETSVGYAIDVYQQSINKSTREYLVNFDYLERLLENYGFVLVTNTDLLNKHGIPAATGTFDELFNGLIDRIADKEVAGSKYGQAQNMTNEEKKISFLNRYFIFEKIRNPNAKSVTLNALNKSETEYEANIKDNERVQNVVEDTIRKSAHSKPKKLKKRLKLSS